MIKVVVAESHPVVREGLVAILGAEPDVEVVGQVDSASLALKAVEDTQPDALLLDLRLGEADGSAVCAAVTTRWPRVKVICLAGFLSEAHMIAAFRAGARGYVIKGSEPALIRQAVRSAVSGGTFIDPKVAGRLVARLGGARRASGDHGLTPAERRVLELLPGGLTNRQIAQMLGVSEDTVKTQLSRAMAKLGVHSRRQAAALLAREGRP